MKKAARRPEYQTFLRLLRESREAKGVTVEELARRLGQAPSHIEASESGAHLMGVFEVWDWCRALDKPFPEFMQKLNEAIREMDDD
jgi:transcriptional regulator with XRE-family HTH domain